MLPPAGGALRPSDMVPLRGPAILCCEESMRRNPDIITTVVKGLYNLCKLCICLLRGVGLRRVPTNAEPRGRIARPSPGRVR